MSSTYEPIHERAARPAGKRMLTVRMTAEQYAAFQAEAHELHTSMNDLAIKKLTAPLGDAVDLEDRWATVEHVIGQRIERLQQQRKQIEDARNQRRSLAARNNGAR